MYKCKNYRPNKNCIQMPGACSPSLGQIIADLYDKDDKFVRSAVVADVSPSPLSVAQKYCDERNQNKDK